MSLSWLRPFIFAFVILILKFVALDPYLQKQKQSQREPAAQRVLSDQ